MYNLLLDSSDSKLSIGISNENEILYSNSFYAWQRQSEYMIPEIEKALNVLNLSLKDISKVVLGIGPGSYTGVRIPLSIAKTMNIANNVEIVPVSSLKILGTNEEKYIALMNARSARSYIGIYCYGQEILKDQVIENNKIDDLIQQYLKEGYVIKGDVDYLDLQDSRTNIVEGLFSYQNSSVCDNPMALCPVYLKDNYGN